MGDPKAKGHELFKGFLERNRIRLDEAATALHVSKTAIAFWRDGQHRPTPDVREAIEKWSGGAIPVSSWMLKGEKVLVDLVQPFKSTAS